MSKKDPTFGINNFNKPKVLTPMETYVKNILLLLFGKPGFYPSIPTIGMNIKQYLYQPFDEISVDLLKTELASQCKDFLPELQTGDLDIVKTVYKDKPMIIFVLPIIDDTSKFSVTLGVTTNDLGEFVYNFIENKTQVI